MGTGSLKTTKFFTDILNAHYLGTSLNAPTKINVGTGTSTPAQGDTALETQVYTDSLAVNYPQVDTGELTATVKMIIGTASANGNNISESAVAGATGNIQSHNVFDAESKSNTDIFVMIEKTKFRNR